MYSPSHGEDDKIYFYDSLNSMIMAANAGEIDELIIPQITAEYIVNVNPDFRISCVGRSHGAYFVLGFKEGDGDALHKKFNEAIIAIKRDGTLEKLQQEYGRKPGTREYEAVKFDKFPGAETIKLAVTGDIPPLDLTTPDDQASGLSAAVVAEAARRLKVNIAVLNVDTGARTTTLASGRADIVAWYEQIRDTKNQYDGARGVLYSEPYHEGEFFMHLRSIELIQKTNLRQHYRLLNNV